MSQLLTYLCTLSGFALSNMTFTLLLCILPRCKCLGNVSLVTYAKGGYVLCQAGWSVVCHQDYLPSNE